MKGNVSLKLYCVISAILLCKWNSFSNMGMPKFFGYQDYWHTVSSRLFVVIVVAALFFSVDIFVAYKV